jgi:hypothetical protein
MTPCQYRSLEFVCVREGIGSLEPILDEVRAEREAQLRHFDALDTKAGILLGFAAALIALSPTGPLLAHLGRVTAAISGFLSLAAFWPRGYRGTNTRRLRDKYLASDAAFTRLHLLDTQVAMAETMRPILLTKARLLKMAMVGLAMAATLTVIGFVLD